MANGWTPERRAKQSAAIHTWKPWARSTGPVTEAGRASSSQNAVIFGDYGREAKAGHKRVADLLRECKLFIQAIR